jgi:hypothetical protein
MPGCDIFIIENISSYLKSMRNILAPMNDWTITLIRLGAANDDSKISRVALEEYQTVSAILAD